MFIRRKNLVRGILMKRIKHSKYKNTGLLFELLVRQTTADVLNENNDESFAIKLIQKYFGKGKPLARELSLYKGLMETKFQSEGRARDLINESIESRKKVSNVSLRKEKYNLIKEIKDNYNADEFFRSKLGNYKNLASIYQLFEAATSDDSELPPAEKVQCSSTLIEHIIGKQILLTDSTEESENKKVIDEYKRMTYKTMLDKFNEKYQGLDFAQKNLLREYIYNVSNTNSFREYVDNEVDRVKSEVGTLVPKIEDKATRIKVEGLIPNIDKLKRGKVVNEDQLVQLMKYFELLKETRKVCEGHKNVKKIV
jgi:hypothetical protein